MFCIVNIENFREIRIVCVLWSIVQTKTTPAPRAPPSAHPGYDYPKPAVPSDGYLYPVPTNKLELPVSLTSRKWLFEGFYICKSCIFAFVSQTKTTPARNQPTPHPGYSYPKPAIHNDGYRYPVPTNKLELPVGVDNIVLLEPCFRAY